MVSFCEIQSKVEKNRIFLSLCLNQTKLNAASSCLFWTMIYCRNNKRNFDGHDLCFKSLLHSSGYVLNWIDMKGSILKCVFHSLYIFPLLTNTLLLVVWWIEGSSLEFDNTHTLVTVCRWLILRWEYVLQLLCATICWQNTVSLRFASSTSHVLQTNFAIDWQQLPSLQWPACLHPFHSFLIRGGEVIWL